MPKDFKDSVERSALEQKKGLSVREYYETSPHLVHLQPKQETADKFQRLIEQILTELRLDMGLANTGVAQVDWENFTHLPLAQSNASGVKPRVGPQDAGSGLFLLPLRAGGPEVIGRLGLMRGAQYTIRNVDELLKEPLVEDLNWSWEERAVIATPIPLSSKDTDKLTYVLMGTSIQPRDWSEQDCELMINHAQQLGYLYSSRDAVKEALENLERKIDLDKLGVTTRERQVLLLLRRKGFKDVEIGRALGITGRTVKAHMKSLRTKLKLKNRTQLVAAVKNLNVGDV